MARTPAVLKDAVLRQTNPGLSLPDKGDSAHPGADGTSGAKPCEGKSKEPDAPAAPASETAARPTDLDRTAAGPISRERAEPSGPPMDPCPECGTLFWRYGRRCPGCKAVRWIRWFRFVHPTMGEWDIDTHNISLFGNGTEDVLIVTSVSDNPSRDWGLPFGHTHVMPIGFYCENDWTGERIPDADFPTHRWLASISPVPSGDSQAAMIVTRNAAGPPNSLDDVFIWRAVLRDARDAGAVFRELKRTRKQIPVVPRTALAREAKPAPSVSDDPHQKGRKTAGLADPPGEDRRAASPAASGRVPPREDLTPGTRALAAAYELLEQGKAVSLRAACRRGRRGSRQRPSELPEGG